MSISLLGHTGPTMIVDRTIDASGKNLSNDERVTLTAVAGLQGVDRQNMFSQYALAKDVTDQGRGAFTGGIEVQSVEDYVKALKAQAEKDGGTDQFGVKAEEYGRIIDTWA